MRRSPDHLQLMILRNITAVLLHLDVSVRALDVCFSCQTCFIYHVSIAVTVH